jgi:hypothetical protein
MTGPGIMFIREDYEDTAKGAVIPNIRDAHGDIRFEAVKPRLEEAADYRGRDSWAEGQSGGPWPVEVMTSKYEGRPRTVVVHAVEFFARGYGPERTPGAESIRMGFYISESDWEGMKEAYGLEEVKRYSEPTKRDFERLLEPGPAGTEDSGLREFLDMEPERQDWGPWTHDPERDVLDLQDDDGRRLYEVDVEDARRSSAEALDWIVQVAGKTWATDRIVAGLVRALDDLIGFQGGVITEDRKKLGR